MRLLLAPALLASALLAAPSAAGTFVSPAPEAVSVSIYRPPGRSGGAIDLDDLQGFALISETRTITIPAGETVIRFEGVADGMISVSAVVAGLPAGVVEKNRDARLLSPAGLMAAYLGQQVTLVRTNTATGRETRVPAIIRSGPDGGAMLETAAGLEALRCSGLPERLVFPSLPAGLTAKPTLSVTARSDRPVAAKVTLSYLARGFDWAANYVAQVRPDGRGLDITAWLTLANGNGTGFPAAQAQVIAGRVEHDAEIADAVPDAGDFTASCWPWNAGTAIPLPAPPMLMREMMVAPAVAMMSDELSQIVVTGNKAVREDLGDLKLYRVPQATDVAARGQKQVLLMTQGAVPFTAIHRFEFTAGDAETDIQASLLLRLKNDAARGLGLPLPSGKVALFETVGGAPMLIGEDDVRDAAIGEEIEIRAGQSNAVRASTGEDADRAGLYHIRLTNARNVQVTAEVALFIDDNERLITTRPRIGKRDGTPTWTVTVPANSEIALDYRAKGRRQR
ncbi:hypothetical protein [Sandarakinorhabdus sp.]|uniref:DUF4139 domain-containing protein n=1 Tax=Sandarakinorhabdus sp. TaxID=1916663 RepID=UPI00286E47C4|nr:hypothetical protein [Sandarakinorhabdus sp.]